MLPSMKRRIAETFIAELVLSVFFAALFFFDVLDQDRGVSFIASLVCIGFNLIFLLVCIRTQYFMEEEPKIKDCLIINITVVLIMAVVSFGLSLFNTEPVYTWLFFPYKILYLTYGVAKPVSSLFVSLIFLAFSVLVTLQIKQPEINPSAEKSFEEVDEQAINENLTDKPEADGELEADEFIDEEDLGEYNA